MGLGLDSLNNFGWLWAIYSVGPWLSGGVLGQMNVGWEYESLIKKVVGSMDSRLVGCISNTVSYTHLTLPTIRA